MNKAGQLKSKALRMLVLTQLAVPFSQASSDDQTVPASQPNIPSTIIFENNKNATVRIRISGAEGIDHGTGFLVTPDGYIITAAHLFSVFKDTTQIQIRGQFGWLRDPIDDEAGIELSLVKFDLASDVAVLHSVGSPDVSPKVVVSLGSDNDLNVGMPIEFLGYPQGNQLSMLSSEVSTFQSGLWRSPGGVLQGNSGGPVFSARTGNVVAIVKAGLTYDKGEPSVTEIVPVSRVRALLKATDPKAYYEMQDKAIVASHQSPFFWSNKPQDMNRTFVISKHPVVLGEDSHSYQIPLKPDPGFRFAADQPTWVETSGNHVSDFNIEVAKDGSSATVQFGLTSGPAVDRWRGWLDGVLTIHQIPAN